MAIYGTTGSDLARRGMTPGQGLAGMGQNMMRRMAFEEEMRQFNAGKAFGQMAYLLNSQYNGNMKRMFADKNLRPFLEQTMGLVYGEQAPMMIDAISAGNESAGQKLQWEAEQWMKNPTFKASFTKGMKQAPVTGKTTQNELPELPEGIGGYKPRATTTETTYRLKNTDYTIDMPESVGTYEPAREGSNVKDEEISSRMGFPDFYNKLQGQVLQQDSQLKDFQAVDNVLGFNRRNLNAYTVDKDSENAQPVVNFMKRYGFGDVQQVETLRNNLLASWQQQQPREFEPIVPGGLGANEFGQVVESHQDNPVLQEAGQRYLDVEEQQVVATGPGRMMPTAPTAQGRKPQAGVQGPMEGVVEPQAPQQGTPQQSQQAAAQPASPQGAVQERWAPVQESVPEDHEIIQEYEDHYVAKKPMPGGKTGLYRIPKSDDQKGLDTPPGVAPLPEGHKNVAVTQGAVVRRGPYGKYREYFKPKTPSDMTVEEVRESMPNDTAARIVHELYREGNPEVTIGNLTPKEAKALKSAVQQKVKKLPAELRTGEAKAAGAAVKDHLGMFLEPGNLSNQMMMMASQMGGVGNLIEAYMPKQVQQERRFELDERKVKLGERQFEESIRQFNKSFEYNTWAKLVDSQLTREGYDIEWAKLKLMEQQLLGDMVVDEARYKAKHLDALVKMMGPLLDTYKPYNEAIAKGEMTPEEAAELWASQSKNPLGNMGQEAMKILFNTITDGQVTALTDVIKSGEDEGLARFFKWLGAMRGGPGPTEGAEYQQLMVPNVSSTGTPQTGSTSSGEQLTEEDLKILRSIEIDLQNATE